MLSKIQQLVLISCISTIATKAYSSRTDLSIIRESTTLSEILEIRLPDARRHNNENELLISGICILNVFSQWAEVYLNKTKNMSNNTLTREALTLLEVHLKDSKSKIKDARFIFSEDSIDTIINETKYAREAGTFPKHPSQQRMTHSDSKSSVLERSIDTCLSQNFLGRIDIDF